MSVPDEPRNWSYSGHSFEAAVISEPNRKSFRAMILRALRERALTTTDLEAVGGSEGTRRLRELRQMGYKIDAHRLIGSTQWVYVLVGEPDASTNGGSHDAD